MKSLFLFITSGISHLFFLYSNGFYILSIALMSSDVKKMSRKFIFNVL